MLIKQVIKVDGVAKFTRQKHIPIAPFPGLLIDGLEVVSVAVGGSRKHDDIEVEMRPGPAVQNLGDEGWHRVIPSA